MPFVQSAAGAVKPQPTFAELVQQYSAAGWQITSDGPSGVQVLGPKKMRTLDSICLILGIIGLFAYGLGLFLILIAVIDYAYFTKREQRFLQRY